MKFYSFIFLFFFVSCKTIPDSTWIIKDVKKDLTEQNLGNSFAVDYFINKELVGIKIIIKKNSMEMRSESNTLIERQQIIKIEKDYILGKTQKGNKIQLKYRLNKEKNQCTFVLPDGTIVSTERI